MRAGADNLRGREGVAAARAYLAPVAVALVGLASMLIVAASEGLPLRDPDARYVGSPLALIGVIALIFLVLDVVPRAWRASRADGGRSYLPELVAVLRERWLGRRGLVVAASLVSFYVTYLSYRNLKSFVPFVTNGSNHDPALLDSERWLFLGADPGKILHDILGTGVSAHVLSAIYLAFLTLVPLSLGFALIWSSRLRVGVWYVTALSITWLLGALSYYLIPALGPVFVEPAVFSSLPETGVTRLQDALLEHRLEVMADPHATTAVQSVAAFASLHIAVVFVAALVAQLVGAARWLRLGMWTFLGLTALATVYFGWHYIIDDVAGLAIGAIAVIAGARLTGFELRPSLRRAGLAQRSASAT